MRLEDKVAIITGAAHGLGKAYALRFAEEGAKVVMADIDGAGGEAVSLETGGWARTTDTSDWDSVEGLMRETAEHFGRVDILVNNAAVYERANLWKGLLEELPLEEWDRLMAVNLRGVFLCCKAVIPLMKQQRHGKILNIASSTFFSGLGDMPHYTISKGGIVAMTRVLAKQLGSWNINVNCFTPGSTLTEEEITDEVMERRRSAGNRRAFARTEKPEDVVGTAVFLASADSDFITGQTIVIDGGGVIY
jgi:NAD(P)-dependent dehydrogenase (short-subunit alcohol dehydrogenase family)